MAVLEKIRVKFGILITVLVALALLSFIIDPSTLQSVAQNFSSDNKVGEMNGKNISYRDFYEEVDHYTKLSEMLGRSVNDEKGQAAVRDLAWQSMFDANVFLPKIEKAGIAVGTQEMRDLTQGEGISPVLLQQGMFLDENGNFSRAALQNFVQSMESDASGQAETYWNFLTTSIYKARIYEKYSNLLVASSIQNPIEKARVMADNNITYDIDYVTVPVGFEPDSTITVSASEIKEYYNARKDNMVQPANRDIEYVMWEVEPSADDFNAAKSAFDELYTEFATAENLKNFISINSDAKWDSYYYSAAQLESKPEFKELAFGKKPSSISEVRTTDNSFSVARVASRANMSDSVKVAYAAFPLTMEASADSLANVAKKGMTDDFKEMGWLTQDITAANGLSDFDAVFNVKAGKVVKVRSLNAQGFFVLYVMERTKPVEKVQLATLVKNVMPSDDTYRDYLMKATDLVDRSEGKYAKFDETVKAENLPVIPMQNVYEATRRIGQCDNARELVRWIFDKKTKKGDVSDVIIVDNKYYFVAAVTNVRKEGTIDIKDVAENIKSKLITDKKIEKLQGEVAEKIASCTTMEEVAAALNASVSHSNGVSFGSQYQQIDNTVLGAVANAAEGVISGPCKGSYGVVVFSISNRQEGSFFTDEDAATYQSQKAAYQTQMLESVITKEADIKDYRARFF